MSAQPTAQYGHTEWTSFAPEMRRSKTRFFAAATSKPSGLARGTSAMPAVPAAPSFRNSRRVISVIGFALFYYRNFAAARRALDFSPDERVLRVAGEALARGCAPARRGYRRAGTRPEDRRGVARTRTGGCAYKGTPLRAARELHGGDRRREIANVERR